MFFFVFFIYIIFFFFFFVINFTKLILFPYPKQTKIRRKKRSSKLSLSHNSVLSSEAFQKSHTVTHLLSDSSTNKRWHFVAFFEVTSSSDFLPTFIFFFFVLFSLKLSLEIAKGSAFWRYIPFNVLCKIHACSISL